jgi:hypothetical protein
MSTFGQEVSGCSAYYPSSLLIMLQYLSLAFQLVSGCYTLVHFKLADNICTWFFSQ